jgi:hypothetical protein
MTGWDYNPEKPDSKFKADLILIKPFEMEELEFSLEKLLSKKLKKKVKSKVTIKEKIGKIQYPPTSSIS